MNEFSFSGLRQAFIDKVNADGTYDIYYANDINNIITSVQAISLGTFNTGILTRYHVGAPVYCGQSYHYQPIILGYADYALDVEAGQVLSLNETSRPMPLSGEIAIQAESGGHIDIYETGDLKIADLHDDGVYISDSHNSITYNSAQKYDFTDSSMTIEGAVKRLQSNFVIGKTPMIIDMLENPEADAFTVDICRDSTRKGAALTKDRGPSKVVRNPPFAEKREVIYEFANSFLVRDVSTETKLVSQFSQTLTDLEGNIPLQRGYGATEINNFDDARFATRTNTMRMDDNAIIERTQGTLVDIFGNLLDINYNKINMPTIDSDGTTNSVLNAHTRLNRSVAYHFQVNSRTEQETGTGKFSLDIDKEGQFRINAPRSTSAGNISAPIQLIDSSDVVNRIDINTVSASATSITSPVNSNLMVGTVFHDMTLTADRLIQNTIQSLNTIHSHNTSSELMSNGGFPNTENTDSTPPDYTTTISVAPSAPAIASEIDISDIGGRSGMLNLEGSLELSVGADVVDNKSIMLDTAGSMVSWHGIDSNGRSIIINTDGEVLLNVGDYITDDEGNNTFNAGSITIRVNLVDTKAAGYDQSSSKSSDHIIQITPQGIVISSGNGCPIAIRSSGDMCLEANGVMDIKGRSIILDSGGTARRVSNKSGVI